MPRHGAQAVVVVAALAVTGGAALAAPPAPKEATALRDPAAAANVIAVTGPAYAAPTVLQSEDFESFDLGTVRGQQGWLIDLVGLSRGADIVQTAIAGFGDRTLMVNDFGRAENETFLPDRAFVRLVIDAQPAASTSIRLMDSISRFTNTRVFFNETGGVDVLQVDPANPSPTQGIFVPTAGSWSLGRSTEIGIELFPDGELVVWQDRHRIFTGKDVVTDLFERGFLLQQPAGFDGLILENFRTGMDDGAGALFDNVRVEDLAEPIPAPGALWVAALAGFAACRRRRAPAGRGHERTTR